MSGKVLNFTGGIGGAGGSGNGNLFADLVQLPAEVDGMSDVKTVVYGNGRIIAPRYGTAEAFYSDDYGTTWKTMALPYAANWEGSTYADGVFLLFDGTSCDKIARSTDNGFTWTTVFLPTTFYGLRSMTYGEGKFVAVCPSRNTSLSSTSGSVLYSTDAGATWKVSRDIPTVASCSIAYGNGMFVAVAYEKESSTTACVSADGINWTSSILHDKGFKFADSVIFADGRFYVFPAETATDTNALGAKIGVSSADGTNWTAFTMPTKGYYRQAAYGNGTLFVLSTKDSTKGYYSTDNGATWQSVSMDSQMAMDTGALAFFCESRFIVIGSNAVYYSETGAELSTWMVDKITSLSIDNIDRTRLVAEALAPYLSVGSGSGGSGDDDGNGSGGSGDSGGGSIVVTGGDVYSTEETVVGTWIDGKPLYRKTVLLPLSGLTANTTAIVGYFADAGVVDAITNYYGAMHASDGGTISLSFYMFPDSVNSLVWLAPAAGEIKVKLGTYYAGLTLLLRLSVEYTKTADMATTGIPSATALMESYDEGVNEA